MTAQHARSRPRQAPADLGELVLAAIARLLFDDPAVEPLGAEQCWLYERCRRFRLPDDPTGALSACLAEPAARDRPLLRLTEALRLAPVELLALRLALLVEEDPMAGRVLAHLQAPVAGSRPTLGLLDAALAPFAAGAWVSGVLLHGPALASGALQLGEETAPLPERSLAMPLGLALALKGEMPAWPGQAAAAPPADLLLPPSLLEGARRQARALLHRRRALLVLRADSAAEGAAVAAALAEALARPPLFLAAERPPAGLGPVCLVTGSVPVFRIGEGADHPLAVPELPGYPGPCVVVAGQEARLSAPAWQVAEWRLALPEREERERLWAHHLGDRALARELAAAHLHSPGRIAELAALAGREADLAGRARPGARELRRAAWAGMGGRLEGLAPPVRDEIPDHALVLPPALRRELQRLMARCRARESLPRHLGVTVQARYRPGVRALLVGPSGTGKTLAAAWLATRLGLPLYRVDLAAVMSKYIGETEKNLAELLARAEYAEIVLLFDEADALFGRRTEVRDANDRFANSQTNYLLQRIEDYRGIVLLTSNSRDRFDGAFTRRLDRILEFPLPGPEERRALWRAHLGEDHAVSGREINQLAALCDLAGGHVRNAVLEAAVIADEAGRPLAMPDLLEGLAGEYRKLGRQFPAELRHALEGR